MANATIREAVGVFHDEKSLHAAADELMISGFDRSDLSLMAGHRTVERKLGRMYVKITELQDDPDVPYMAYVGTDSRTEGKAAVIGGLSYVGAVAAAGMVVASGGTAAAVLIGAAAAGGAGGLIGAALSRFIDRHHAGYLQAQLDRGGLVLVGVLPLAATAADRHDGQQAAQTAQKCMAFPQRQSERNIARGMCCLTQFGTGGTRSGSLLAPPDCMA